MVDLHFDFIVEACIDASGSFLGILGPLEGCHVRSYLGPARTAWELHAAKRGNGTSDPDSDENDGAREPVGLSAYFQDSEPWRPAKAR